MMNQKKLTNLFKILSLLLIATPNYNNVLAQTVILPNSDSRVITTAVPFLLIASDARGAGLGDMGVATSVDTYSQQWNPSKYAFSETKSGFGVSYTPYLSKLVNDISISSLNYFNRINERSAFAGSFKYFSLGEIELRNGPDDIPIIEKPNELNIDASYSLRLSDNFSMAVSLGYIRSDLKLSLIHI